MCLAQPCCCRQAADKHFIPCVWLFLRLHHIFGCEHCANVTRTVPNYFKATFFMCLQKLFVFSPKDAQLAFILQNTAGSISNQIHLLIKFCRASEQHLDQHVYVAQCRKCMQIIESLLRHLSSSSCSTVAYFSYLGEVLE